MATKKDLFDQFMSMSVTMSGVNTLTFGEVAIGMSIFDYAAFIISRVEYVIDRAMWAEFATNADELQMAICGSDSIGDLGLARPEVYDHLTVDCNNAGTPATLSVHVQPAIHDFTGMKGGGLLVPAQNIYLGIDTVGFAAAGVGHARVYFTVKPLAAPDFIELTQRLRVLST